MMAGCIPHGLPFFPYICFIDEIIFSIKRRALFTGRPYRSRDSMTQRLQNKRALVTAAGNGIGLASALAMAREGAEVWATDINQDALAQLAAGAGRGPGQAAHARAERAGHASGASLRPGDRRAGRVVQLRRPRPRRQHPRMPGIRLGLRHGPERQVHAPHDPRLPAGHARTRRRLHHQHVLGRFQRQGRASTATPTARPRPP